MGEYVSQYETLGQHFRTPAHPDVLMALGRVMFNFLSLEETVATILYEVGVSDLSTTRGKMAKAKGRALESLADLYRQQPGGKPVAECLDAACLAFHEVRQSVRNRVMHAHPFTAGKDEEGNYLPGLGYTFPHGREWITVATSPDDLLALAHAVEGAGVVMNEARTAVRNTPLAS